MQHLVLLKVLISDQNILLTPNFWTVVCLQYGREPIAIYYKWTYQINITIDILYNISQYSNVSMFIVNVINYSVNCYFWEKLKALESFVLRWLGLIFSQF